VIDGQYVGIEVKAPKGKQSDHQKEFQKRLEEAGAKYVLAYSLDDVLAAI
jgi:predicted SprT family Zn-dependent metalloprotease